MRHQPQAVLLMKVIIFHLFLFYSLFCSGQKMRISQDNFFPWERISGTPLITSNGKYAAFYSVDPSTVTVTQLEGNWRYTMKGGGTPVFSRNNNYVLFGKGRDTLFILRLGTDYREIAIGIKSWKIPDAEFWKDWIAFLKHGKEKTLTLKNLASGETLQFNNVTNYHFLKDKILLQKGDTSELHGLKYELTVFELNKKKEKSIWKGDSITMVESNQDHSRIAFVEKRKTVSNSSFLIWYYNSNNDYIEELTTGDFFKKNTNISEEVSSFHFSKDGERIFFSLQKPPTPIQKKIGVISPELFSWSDYAIDYFPKRKSNTNLNKLIVYSIFTKEWISLLKENDELNIMKSNEDEGLEVLIWHKKPYELEAFWNPDLQPSLELISALTGKRKIIRKKLNADISNVVISPHGHYVLYFDRDVKKYFLYETKTETTKDLSNIVPHSLFDTTGGRASLYPYGFAGWLHKDDQLLIYDQFDIWLIDALNNNRAINMTNGYGRKNKIVFRLLHNGNSELPVLKRDDDFIISAFDLNTKNNGFYLIHQEWQRDPERLTMGPYIYHLGPRTGNDLFTSRFVPVKAKNANSFIVQRMSESESPNYFFTKNFKSFKAISEIKPEKSFNWVTTQLYECQTGEGKRSCGLLFKPEDFDSTKRYPLIVSIYEKFSDELHSYRMPASSSGSLNIPYFVSNGYLVFMPDINYQVGNPGQSIVRDISSSIESLRIQNWIDSTKIGIHGHSYGGFEVNLLIGKTNYFTAAVSASGICNLFSHYAFINGQYNIEVGQHRLAATIWQNPNAFFNNSPLFFADKVNTPLLLVHNRDDKVVPFVQSFEFFSALRRLGKKVWLIQYDKQDHVFNGSASRDYSERTFQFFNFFLKGGRKPEWITTHN